MGFLPVGLDTGQAVGVDDADGVLLRATGITKRYGGIAALGGVGIALRPGEVHALMGENGAGKSTMAKILAGVELADAGSIEWLGAPATYHTTREAVAAGIAIVLQELSLIPDLSVAENIFLTHGDAYRRGLWLDRRAIRRRTRQLFDRLGWELPVEPDRKVGELSVAEQQMVEIVRALSLDARLYILDEPTAPLGAREVDVLFRLIRRLRDNGAAFLLVTHRLDEVYALADRITVYRDGLPSGDFETARTGRDVLIRAMVGRDLGDLFEIRQRRPLGGTPERVPDRALGAAPDQASPSGREQVADGRAGAAIGGPMLAVRHLSRGDLVRDASFEVRRGEIVGVAGLVGAGRTELVRAVFGADRSDRGEVVVRGRVGLVSSPRRAIAAGAAMVPEDRKAQGLLVELPIDQNVMMADLAATGGFWRNPRRERSRVGQLVADLRIKAPRTWQAANSLSGGNQQKVVLAKWLAIEPDLLILDEPTRGIDIGTKFELYKLIDALAARGVAVLLVSSELPELLALADRILVMRNGAIVAELPHAAATEEAILAAAVSEAA